jgi:polysaccharide export outer membrane protein
MFLAVDGEESMKAMKLVQNINLISLCVLVFALAVLAQTPTAQPEKIAQLDTKPAPNQEIKADKTKKGKKGKKTKEDAPAVISQPTPEVKETDENLPEVEAAVLPYYNNYLTEYRLGPNDVISVEVFGQCPDYCITGKTVPPTAKISYPLIREGVLVGGKTIEQVQDEITKKLNEYIIDPKVSVTLDKAMSARYSVLGKVAAPGVRVMDRKVSLYEAIVESGGVLKDGDKKRVTLYRMDAQGRLAAQTINLQEMERGKADMVFLSPGDQVFVPDQGFKLNVNTVFNILQKASIARLLFGSPF